MQDLAQSTANAISEGYDIAGGWTQEVLANASSASAASSDVGVQVLNADGEVIYDDAWSREHRLGDSGAGTDTSSTSTSTTTSSLVPTSAESIVTADVVDDDGNVVGMRSTCVRRGSIQTSVKS